MKYVKPLFENENENEEFSAGDVMSIKGEFKYFWEKLEKECGKMHTKINRW